MKACVICHSYIFKKEFQSYLRYQTREPHSSDKNHFTISGNLEPMVFGEAWNVVIERHLACAVQDVFGEYEREEQKVNSSFTVSFDFEDCRQLQNSEGDWCKLLPESHEKSVKKEPVIRLFLRQVEDDVWRFAISQCPVVMDRLSLKIALRETLLCYYAILRPDDYPPLPVSKCPFINFVQQLDLYDPSTDEKFWLNYLAEVSSPTKLAVDLSNNAEIGGVRTDITLSADIGHLVSKRVHAHCDRLNISFSTLVYAALARVIGTYSSEDSVLFGITTDGRPPNMEGAEEMVGPFTRILPFRVRISPQYNVSDWLKEIEQHLLHVRSHQLTKLTRIKELSDLDQGKALFEMLVDVQYCPISIEEADFHGQMHLSDYGYNVSDHEYPFVIRVFAGKGIGISFTYDSRRLEQINATELFNQFQLLLIRLSNESERRLWEIETVGGRYAQRALRDWNSTEQKFDQLLTLHGMVERQALLLPNQTAVIAIDGHLDYAELNRRANQLARKLIALGVCPGDRVGLCTGKSTATVVAILGVMKAGAAYVPIDPAYPANRVAYMVEDAQLSVMLIWGDSIEVSFDLKVPTIGLDTDWSSIATYSGDPLEFAVASEAFAYVIYTSGSSGEPKGVMLNHRGRVNNIRDYCQRLKFDHSDRVLCVSSLSFDISVCNIFCMLNVGGCVIFPDIDREKDPDHWLDLIGRYDVTFWHSAPSLLDALLDATNDRPYIRDSLQIALVGGDWIPLDQPDRARTAFPKMKFISAGGATELSIDSTVYMVGAIQPDWRSIPYGRPMANQTALILDAHMALVPIGVPGELYLGGVGLAAGYLHRAELTAEKFVPHPWPVQPGERLYRTGDLAKYGADGLIELLGRIDFQVKIRGVRIELGEIEAVLRKHPLLSECLVTAPNKAVTAPRRLIAYIVPLAPNMHDTLIAELRPWLRSRVPEHLVPEAFVILERLPLTPNGKVDRRNLPLPDLDRLQSDAYEAPQGVLEQRLANIWLALLHSDQVGRYDHFFDAGGYSLQAMRLLARIRSEFGVDLPVSVLFENPTIITLASVIAGASYDSNSLAAPSIVSVAGARQRVLSFAQQRLWFLSQLDAEISKAYHIPMALRLRGSLNKVAWRKSLNTLWARHDTLRTTVSSINGQPYIELLSSLVGLPLIEHDLQHQLNPGEQLAQLCTDEIYASFDLSQGPLIRARLIQLTEYEHVFLLTQHHIISDGWSIGILIRELNLLYAAFNCGHDNPLPPLAIQYSDFADWQQRWLTGERLENKIDYWRKALVGIPVQIELPTDRPRPTQQSFSGATHSIQFDIALVQGLKKLCRQRGVTLFMALITAWAAVLARLSGQDDLVIGTPTANRNFSEIEPLIGFFVNTLALRVDLSGTPSVAELMARICRSAILAQDNQDLPFEHVVETVNPPRRLSHTPLFQVLFAWQNNYKETPNLPDLDVETMKLSFDLVKFDLELSLSEHGDTIQGEFIYSTALFDKTTIERHSGYLKTMLEAMVFDSDQSIKHIDIMTSSERFLLLNTWNQTSARCPDQLCIHELFEQQTRDNPGAIAVAYEDESLTYSQLNEKANRVAHHLIAQGVQPDERVAICIERNLAMVVSILAVLKAGGAYVPLDASFPDERLDFMLTDSAAVAVLLQDTLQNRLTSWQGAILVLTAAGESTLCANQAVTNPDIDALGLRSSNLAYLIYTSGSTGQPKGVLVEHRQIRRLLASTETEFNFRPNDIWTLFHSYAFDFSVWEFWGALAYGGQLVVVPQWIARSPEDFYKLLHARQVTVLNQTPTSFSQLSRIDAKYNDELSLRVIIFGGEALNMGELKGWVRRHGDQAPILVNMYGITETTVHVTYRRILHRDISENVRGVIGRPIEDLKLYLLDTHKNLVPIGSSGEIYVGGAGVARGYLNRPGLTATRFLDNPYAVGDRLYRSGDLARHLPNGELEYLGRIDEQVKIRGFRIEPGEIEHHICKLPEVLKSVVVMREDIPDIKQLVAYIILVDPPSEKSTKIEFEGSLIRNFREQLTNVLPYYMVPATFILLDSLPRTSNGKVDFKRLPIPDRNTDFSEHTLPRNAIETALCETWENVLQRKPVGIRDNYFSLGGDSILSIRIVAELRQRGLSISIKDIFEHQTIEQLALQTNSDIKESLLPTFEPFSLLNKHERALYDQQFEDAYPMSALQLGMVFHSQVENFGGIYHDIMSDTVKCPWDQVCFEDALSVCIQENPILRTGFRLDSSKPLQHVFVKIELPLVVEDLRRQSLGEQNSYLAQWVEQRKTHVFDWKNGPLLTVHIFRRTDEEFECALSFHHAILDGWSAATLKTSLYGDYMRRLMGDAKLPHFPDRTYRDFIELEEYALTDPASKRYFMRMLEAAPVKQLPREDSPVKDRSQRRLMLEPFITLSNRLILLATYLGVPVQAVLLAAHFKTLSTISGQPHVVSCVVQNGRPEAIDAERGLGLFLNALPQSFELVKGSWRDLIQTVAQSMVESMGYRRYPLSKIQQDTGLSFSEVLFNYTHFHAYNELDIYKKHGFEIKGSFNFEVTNFDLAIYISRELSSDSLSLELVYNEEIFNDELMIRFGSYYLSACEELLDGLDEQHHLKSLLSIAERQHLLIDWNKTTLCYPNQLCIHELFEEKVRNCPNAIAVVYEDQSITYEQLNVQANRIAHYLIAQGVRPDERVAICAERNIFMIIGLLSILKAGGAYVPLDPSYPMERITKILLDAEPVLLLCDASGFGAADDKALKHMTMLNLESQHHSWHLQPSTTPDLRSLGLTPNHLAYVIYTSGSTGTPKGVAMQHDSLVNLIYWEISRSTQPARRTLQFAALGFDVAFQEIFGTLCAGGELELIHSSIRVDFKKLYHYVCKRQIGRIYLPYSALQGLAETIVDFAEDDPIRHAPCVVSEIITAGEQLRITPQITALFKKLSGCLLRNHYGPTESHVVTEFTLPNAVEEWTSLPPIGRPIANARIYLLDTFGQPVPLGTAGEIYIGGACLARGYLRRHELTIERFVDDPFSSTQNARMYRTGDIARYLPDGNLMFLGRNDHQVKIRGFRIETGEVEARLAEHYSIREVVVIARENPTGGKHLVAYMVRAPGCLEGTEELAKSLHSHLATFLPEYMIPAAFVPLEFLPLTPNGKLDRKALPEPERDAFAQEAYEPPLGEIEVMLAQLWEELLGLQNISRHDNFFSLGGHSLIAVRLLGRIQKEIDVSINFSTLFNYPKLKSFAKQIIITCLKQEFELDELQDYVFRLN